MPTVNEKIGQYGKELIDYEAIVKNYPWILQEKMNCILSPDSDGLLCGLLMGHVFDWSVKGFYDGKILVVEKGVDIQQCVFLDMEILRQGICSVGHHMLLYNKRNIPPQLGALENCISINTIRKYDAQHDFALKYPFATIHLLLGIVGSTRIVQFPPSALTALLFTDGTWMNLVKYTENSLDWIRFLRADEPSSPLHPIFMNDEHTLHSLLVAMNDFLRRRDAISVHRERGDRVAITLRGGEGLPHNLELDGTTYSFKEDAKQRAERFLRLLAELTRWEYDANKWAWNNWVFYKFTKETAQGLTGRRFTEIIARNPLSLAITGTKRMEYTIEAPDHLP